LIDLPFQPDDERDERRHNLGLAILRNRHPRTLCGGVLTIDRIHVGIGRPAECTRMHKIDRDAAHAEIVRKPLRSAVRYGTR